MSFEDTTEVPSGVEHTTEAPPVSQHTIEVPSVFDCVRFSEETPGLYGDVKRRFEQ